MDKRDISCNMCHGNGYGELICEEVDRYRYKVCRKCNGRGCVNWIENIFGATSDVMRAIEIVVFKKHTEEIIISELQKLD